MFDFEEFKRKLAYYFEKYGLPFDEQILAKFHIFANYLMCENRKYNLTAIHDLDGVIVKHFVDSSVILNFFDFCKDANIIDIGAGAGFPSIPIAIFREDLNIACLDSANKKIEFIKSAARLLELENINAICVRAEELKLSEQYDFAVSRAVARLNVLCELIAPNLKIDGIFCAYKAKSTDEELHECNRAFEVLGLELADVLRFQLEWEERAFILVRKIKATPDGYPRNFSQISKNPL